jgi:elongation factor Ts
MSTLEQIKELRAKTGIGMVDAKKALDEAGGDTEKAIASLRKLGAIKAAKKGDRDTNEGLVRSYLHSNGKMGALVVVACETDFVARNEDFEQLVNDIAMHIAATDPIYLAKEDVPAEVIKHEEEVARESLKSEGKPSEIIEKALPGRINMYYIENCLLEQKFIKDESKTITQLVEESVAKLGENIKIKRFIRFSL